MTVLPDYLKTVFYFKKKSKITCYIRILFTSIYYHPQFQQKPLHILKELPALSENAIHIAHWKINTINVINKKSEVVYF